MQHYINPALSFQTQINFINNLAQIPYQANQNAVKTINGLSNIVDSLQITLFPDLVDLLVNSRSFIGTVLEGRINKAYRIEPIIKINDDNLDPDALRIIQENIKILLSRPFHIKHPFGRNTPLQAISEGVKLAERHGGCVMMMCYDNEGLSYDSSRSSAPHLAEPMDPNDIDTKRKLMFFPIPLTNGNQGSLQQFFSNLEKGDKIDREAFYNVNAYDIIQSPTVDLALFNNGARYKIHTSRLVPIYSGIKARTFGTMTQGWDMSALQGSLRSINNYYIFIDTIPEMLQEKIHNNVSVGGLDLMNANPATMASLQNMIKEFGQNTGVKNYNFLPDGTTVHRDNLQLNDLESIQRILERQIVMETDALLMDITGEGAKGFSSGNDVQINSQEKLAKIHTKYDWVFEYFLSRLVVNTQTKVVKGLHPDKIDIVFDLSPQKTAEDMIKEQQQTIQNIIQLNQAGIMSMEDVINNLTSDNITNLTFSKKDFFK
jgi:hypothetical protein